MDQKLFEFIWDQSKKNQDKNLIEFLVNLDTDIKMTQKCTGEDINCVFQEIKKCLNDLQIQMDDIRNQMDERLHCLEIDLRQEFINNKNSNIN